ncbi:hypothetical protein KBX50_03185 [Micromonospora sp. C51]|uniref:hypothetical protein n=1 Tax=Micromonospora sp. C51 TaxID=2824879 RepID=UPI001B36B4B6|nr:hypothetical protein [Micromonospora sp. C51]MBQ1047492.1 hypothetical protein [Micromonospora sp. C51]
MPFAPNDKAALDDYFTALRAVHQAGTNIGGHSQTATQMSALRQTFLALDGVNNVSFTVAAVWPAVQDVTARVKLLATQLMATPPVGLNPGQVTLALQQLEDAHNTVSNLYGASQSTGMQLIMDYL